ncbi:MAG: hypothetical protein O7G87_13650, partial [bacterium]|nr:hypothetical protein [bacterium]
IIIFAPTTEGELTGTLTILSNDPEQPAFQITLAGLATGPALPTPTRPTPDFNGDGLVNFSDFLAFAAAFGTRSGDAFYDARFDLDSSGDIAFPDFLTFAAAFGKPLEG